MGQGNTDMKDLVEKAAKHKDQLAALMITYPSTHGVFEDTIVEICKIVHDNGGLVYMDGANMNAQVLPPRPRRCARGTELLWGGAACVDCLSLSGGGLTVCLP